MNTSQNCEFKCNWCGLNRKDPHYNALYRSRYGHKLCFCRCHSPFSLEPNVRFQIHHLNLCQKVRLGKMQVMRGSKMTNQNENIVKHRQKKAPYTKIQRKERRDEVYRLHFDNGMPATRIGQMMK